MYIIFVSNYIQDIFLKRDLLTIVIQIFENLYNIIRLSNRNKLYMYFIRFFMLLLFLKKKN